MMMHNFSIFGPTIKAGVLQENVLGDLPFRVQFVAQTHGDGVLVVNEYVKDEGPYDAMVSRAAGVRLMIKTADCIPLVLSDENAGVIGAVHAGWRSLVKDILYRTVEKMVELGAEIENIRVAIGPSLGVECAEFSDPVSEIPSKYHWAIGENKHVDLNGICAWQLEDLGVRSENIEWMKICTSCNLDWFSWRRNGCVERFGTFIELED